MTTEEFQLWLDEEITVCDRCLTSCCWQGIFMCDNADIAGTTRITRRSAVALAREHPTYMKTDEELAAS